MRPSILIAMLVLAIGCDSKPEVQAPDGGFPPPSISAAPGSKPAPRAEPADKPEADAGQIDEELADEAPAEPKASARKRSRSSVGASGVGTSGNASGGGGLGDGSLDGLLEADAPSNWSVRLISTDSSDELKTSQMLIRRTAMLRRCASFLAKETERLRCDVTYDGAVPKSVKTSPANDTAGECVRVQLSKVRFPGAPTTLSFEFRR